MKINVLGCNSIGMLTDAMKRQMMRGEQMREKERERERENQSQSHWQKR